MSRYVDIEKANVEDIRTRYDGIDLYYDDIQEWLDEQPTADVEEVKHGKWILIEEDVDGNGNNQYRCSLCEAGELHAPFVIVPYCWKCGAKMDKEKE